MLRILGLAMIAMLCACKIGDGEFDSSDDQDRSSLFDETDPSDGDTPPSAAGGDAGMGDAAMGNGSKSNPIGGPAASTFLNGKKPTMAPDSSDATSAGLHGLVTDLEQPGDDGDETWTITEDLDGDGVGDKVVVVFDDETGDLYLQYETVIEQWCSDGSDAMADVLEIYYESQSVDVVLWETDCPEDRGIIFGCDLDSNGEVTDTCGVCAQREGVWICDVFEGEPPAGDGDTGDGDGDTTVMSDDCSIEDAPDLSDRDLTGCDLTGAMLSFASLDGAKLEGANLSGANLAGADLGRAQLSGANLEGADLTGADLDDAVVHDANLQRAILTGVYMWMVDFNGSNLTRANLNNADLSFALLYDVNLTDASMTGATLTDVAWMNTTCPDRSNSDSNSGSTCVGHLQ